jgi:hypothetical protein
MMNIQMLQYYVRLSVRFLTDSATTPCTWCMYIFWPYGLDKPPVWQQHETYSGLTPNLDYRGMPIA